MLKGIDVSYSQTKVNWAKVKNDEVNFVMIRSSFGWMTNSDKQKDKMFESHYKGAKAVGLPVGAYHYSYATSVEDAIREADYCYSIIKGKQFEYPIAYDLEEDRTAQLGKEMVSKIAKAFCDKMEQYGYYVCIYAGKNWLNDYLTEDVLNRYDVWLAQWGKEPTYNGAFSMWQYSSKGNVNGIKGNVDMNECYKDYPSIIKNGNFNGFTNKPNKTVDEIAHEVLNGKWGNGAIRKKRLKDAGYNPSIIQARVNALKKAETIKAGDFVKIKNGSKDMNTGKRLAMWAYGRTYKVDVVRDVRAVLSYKGTVVTAQYIENIKKV